MAVLGLLILALAAALTVDVVLENMKTLRPDPMVIGQTVSSINVGTLFLSGVVIGVLGMLGLSLLLAGLKRARRRRQERKELARSYQGAAGAAESLHEERDRLAAELEAERAKNQGGRERSTVVQRVTRAGGRSGDHDGDGVPDEGDLRDDRGGQVGAVREDEAEGGGRTFRRT